MSGNDDKNVVRLFPHLVTPDGEEGSEGQDDSQDLEARAIDLLGESPEDFRTGTTAFLELAATWVYRIYDRYEEHDKHFFFPRETIQSPGLLVDARESFIEGDDLVCARSLVDFCRQNPGSILEKDLPFPTKHRQGVRFWTAVLKPGNTVIDDIDPDREVMYLQADSLDPDPVIQQAKAKSLFSVGKVRDALAHWTRAYQTDLSFMASRNSLVAFYAVVMNDFNALREFVYKTMKTHDFGDAMFQTLTDIAALEHKKEERLSGVRQFISQHDVYELKSADDSHEVHIITKISKQGGKERLEQEKKNLKTLTEQVGDVTVLGAHMNLPSQIEVNGVYPDFSVMLEHFITDSLTLHDMFRENVVEEQERLRHMEVAVAYTAYLQKQGTTLLPGESVTIDDYIDSVRSKLARFKEGLSREDEQYLENINTLARRLLEGSEGLPDVFYTNASPKNFLVYAGDSADYYFKIDFESDEHRCNLIDPITLADDPFARLERHRSYLLSLYSAVFYHDLTRLRESDILFNRFFKRRDEARYTSQEEARLFEDRYARMFPDIHGRVIDASVPLSRFRDMTIIIDKLIENRRLQQTLDNLPPDREDDTPAFRGNILRMDAVIAENEWDMSVRRGRLYDHIDNISDRETFDALSYFEIF